jgi:hypothetical protein
MRRSQRLTLLCEMWRAMCRCLLIHQVMLIEVELNFETLLFHFLHADFGSSGS